MTTRQHGGPRTPAQPAAVSGPGALSQRTDGGAGSTGQPIRVPAGGAYGEAGALEAQQQGAPMADGTSPGAGGASAAAGGPQPAPEGIFQPTANPAQPITSGVMGGPMGGEPDPEMVLRELVKKFPSPYLMRLLGS